MEVEEEVEEEMDEEEVDASLFVLNLFFPCPDSPPPLPFQPGRRHICLWRILRTNWYKVIKT